MEDAQGTDRRASPIAGRDRRQLVSRYLFGMCGPLALAIHERTGWDTYGVFDADGGDWTDKPRHVACRAPDGTFADARGTGLSEDTLVSAYRRTEAGPLEVRPFGVEAIREMFSARTIEEHDLARANLHLLLPGLPCPEELSPERGHGQEHDIQGLGVSPRSP